jgi:uncharacterized repeat protein (TIGR02543 family)
VTIAPNSTVAEPTAPTKSGYTFGGWYTDDTTFINSFNFSTTLTANIILYAKWTAVKYRFTFRYNNGAADSYEDIDFGTTVVKPNDPVRADYEFKGWFTDVGFTYEYDFLSPMPNHSVIIFAKWYPDRTAINSAIAAAENYVSIGDDKYYTADSYGYFTDAIQTAKTVGANTESTVGSLKAQINALGTAIESLQFNTKVLTDLLHKDSTIDYKIFTTQSYGDWVEAYDDAVAYLGAQTYTLDGIKAHEFSLDTAFNALEENFNSNDPNVADDKSKLWDLLESIKSSDDDDYVISPESGTDMEGIIDLIESKIDDKDLTYGQLEEFIDELQNVLKINKEKFRQQRLLIWSAISGKGSDYTSETWQDLLNTDGELQDMLKDDTDATLTQIKDALDQLKTAQSNLQLKELANKGLNPAVIGVLAAMGVLLIGVPFIVAMRPRKKTSTV